MSIENKNSSKQFAHESIAASEQVANPIKLTIEDLPWINEPVELNTALVTMKDATCPPFMVASAIGTSDKLVAAANGMTSGQRQNTDNMFWSRLGGFIRDGYHSKIEIMPSPATKDPIYCMRNTGGQRVYFGVRKTEEGTPLVIRLAACDKNKQDEVMKVVSGAKDRTRRMKMSEN
jgi:hypothetical protein